MDNLCHTLAGAALAEAGLKRTTRFGTAALVVAANLPDIDVLSFLSETPAVALRRGWTHGIVAQIGLPIALTAVLVLLDRWRPPRSSDVPRLRVGPLLFLSYLGILSHVGMDWLNNYGVRLLMPLSNRWFYGDSVFIVDPWLWLALGVGVWMARKRRTPAPARVAVVIATAYITAMIASALAARERVSAEWTARRGAPPAALMVGPVPVNPLRKTVIVDAGDAYVRGVFRWPSGALELDPRMVPKRHDDPDARRAAELPHFKGLLVWSRFPYYEVSRTPVGVRVRLGDMRFADRDLFTAVAVLPD